VPNDLKSNVPDAPLAVTAALAIALASVFPAIALWLQTLLHWHAYLRAKAGRCLR